MPIWMFSKDRNQGRWGALMMPPASSLSIPIREQTMPIRRPLGYASFDG
jgi:hypothetical protein